MGEERLGFDNVPEIYDRARPSYPPALFDDLLEYAGTPSSGVLRALEIGPGTGKATASLLERGVEVTAVEIGANLAAFLKNKFAGLKPDPRVGNERLTVINSAFEDVAVEPASYDLVVSATAFHWVDPAERYVKSRDALRAGGALAIISTNQIASGVDRGYFDRVRPIYLKYWPDEHLAELSGEDVTPAEHGDLLASGLFADVALRRYRWDQTYPTAQYADLVRSYANTQAMMPDASEALIADLCEVIDREYGGSVTRPLVMTLTLGRKGLG